MTDPLAHNEAVLSSVDALTSLVWESICHEGADPDSRAAILRRLSRALLDTADAVHAHAAHISPPLFDRDIPRALVAAYAALDATPPRLAAYWATRYRRGASLARIAAETKINKSVIRGVLVAAGATIRSNRPAAPDARQSRTAKSQPSNTIASGADVRYTKVLAALGSSGVPRRPLNRGSTRAVLAPGRNAAKPIAIARKLQVDPAIVVELIRRYNAGETMEHLASQYPLSYWKVRDILIRADVTIRPRKILLPPTPPGLVNAYNAGRTIQQLGATHGMSYNQTRRVLLAEGVQLRPRGQPSG